MYRTRRFPFLAAVLVVAATCLYVTGQAIASESGQRNFAQVSVEPAVDSFNGSAVYLLTPIKSPFPSKANTVATAPLYLPLYPLSSTVPASDLNCQPTNCDHANVLPFHFAGYDALPGTAPACVDFNGGQDCALVKGHDHLVGVPPTGDFNVAWHVMLVVFTTKAFGDGAINTRITTLDQLNNLKTSGDVIVLDTPVTFNCSITSEQTYERGTPVVIPFP